MTSVLLLTPAPDLALDAVEARPVRLRDRIVARVRAFDLDRRLADGVAPERSAALALRARRLVDPRYGERLARRLGEVVHEALLGRRRRVSIPVRLDAVAAVAGEIDDLARRLAAPRAASVRGIAQVGLLLSDGAGPLYSARAAEDLGAAVRRARAALELV
jgi:hypothetical protein